MALPPRDQRHQYLRFMGLDYTDANITDFEERLELMDKGLSGRMLKEYMDAQRQGAEIARQIPDKGDLGAYCIGILSARDFLGTTPSYTSIRDPMLRLYHWLFACSIAGRSQAPEKVTMTDFFF
ncbi:hypothetical protein Tco_0285999 [Tanacetum coccineum]